MSAPTTKKQLASRHVRRLNTIREKLLAMSGDWEDVDQFCVSELESLADAAESVANSLLDASAPSNGGT